VIPQNWLRRIRSREDQLYALVGMGTAFAGIIRAPFTSVIMIFEMTRDYTIIVPLMISNLVSFYTSSRLQRTPVDEALSHQIEIHLPSAPTKRDASQYRVRDAMRAPTIPLTVVEVVATNEAALE